MSRQKDVNWNINANQSGNFSMDSATLATLMDIRDELQTLNRLLACQNFVNIPRTLNSIRRAMPVKKKA